MNLLIQSEITFYIRCEECEKSPVMDIIIQEDMRSYKTLKCPNCGKKVSFNYHIQEIIS